MTTNRVTKGNNLRTLVLQPGWTIENDGYGLLTARATYIQSHGNDAGTKGGDGPYGLTAAPSRGAPFIKDARLTCHRSSSSLNSNGLLVVTADYVGIESGNMTTPEVSGKGATNTEAIATHPVFVSQIGGKKGAPLNGAEFEPDSDAFKAFTNPEYKKYGVKSYFAPTFAITGHFYTSDIETVKTLKSCICTVSSDCQWNNIQLVGKLNAVGTNAGSSWAGIMAWAAPDESPQLMLNGISIEDYGSLYKIGFDILVTMDGWDTDIYPYATDGWPKRDQTK